MAKPLGALGSRWDIDTFIRMAAPMEDPRYADWARKESLVPTKIAIGVMKDVGEAVRVRAAEELGQTRHFDRVA